VPFLFLVMVMDMLRISHDVKNTSNLSRSFFKKIDSEDCPVGSLTVPIIPFFMVQFLGFPPSPPTSPPVLKLFPAPKFEYLFPSHRLPGFNSS